MRVLAVSSWGGACGIANYLDLLKEAVEGADPGIEILPWAEGLDPAACPPYAGDYDVLYLNYHRGLHSRWTHAVLSDWITADAKQRQARVPVVITFHDTYGQTEPDALTKALHNLADVFVVHEPCVGLPKAVVIRQGVPAWPGYYVLDHSAGGPFNGRPVLGTCGFNFPWKNFGRLAEVTAQCGWGYLVVSNNASMADEASWRSLNPYTQVIRGFLPTTEIVARLGGCDATCFAYECANSGTSGAIRLGLAVRKPVIAFQGCRQFRDLQEGAGRDGGIRWCSGFDNLWRILRHVPIQRCDPGIVALAERDSWVKQGQTYARLFRGLVA